MLPTLCFAGWTGTHLHNQNVFFRPFLLQWFIGTLRKLVPPAVYHNEITANAYIMVMNGWMVHCFAGFCLANVLEVLIKFVLHLNANVAYVYASKSSLSLENG